MNISHNYKTDDSIDHEHITSPINEDKEFTVPYPYVQLENEIQLIKSRINKINKKSYNIILGKPFILNTPKNIEKPYLFVDKSCVFDGKREKRKRGRPTKEQSTMLMNRQNKRLSYNAIYQHILENVFLGAKGEWLAKYKLSRVIMESPRTLRYHLKELVRTKWLMKIGRAGYYLHPLLDLLLNHYHYFELLEYANYKVDFVKLLSEPLRYIDKPIDFKISAIEQSYQYQNQTPYNGYVIIVAEMENGLKLQTILPLNIHYSHGYKKDIPHYCIPINWKLFNIENSHYLSGNDIFVHFDNSITISYKRKKFSFFGRGRHYLEDVTERWTGEGNEYLEVNNLDTLQKLFNLRFKDGLTGIELFKAMGLEVKNGFGRPKKIAINQ